MLAGAEADICEGLISQSAAASSNGASKYFNAAQVVKKTVYF